LLSLALLALTGEATTRHVYVSALDSNGAPVTDLTAADFSLKEGGKAREITRAERATAPMQIAIVVDDNGTGIFRVAVARFIEAMYGRAEFAISTVSGQTRKIVDYTVSREALSQALNQLGVRPGSPDGGQLLEGITETSMEMLKRKAGRPVILVLTVGGEEHTMMQPHHALDQLRQSGAALHVVSVLNSAMRAVAPPSKPSDLLNENLGLHEVLGDGPKRSGGHREEIAAIAGVTTGLQKLAEQLKRQYVIEYSLDGAKPSGRLNVSVKRKGVTVRAPTHVPDKM
jgi:VWFA-related protein